MNVWGNIQNSPSPHQLRRMQRARLVPVLRRERQEADQEHGVRQLDQAHPVAMQRRPADLRQPVQQRLGITLLKGQRYAAYCQQHRAARYEVAEQVGFSCHNA